MNSISTRVVQLTVGGAGLLFMSYWLIFVLTTEDGVSGGALNAVLNALPAVLLAIVVHLILDRFVWDRGAGALQLVHIPLALSFAVIWYLSIRIIGGLQGGSLAEGLFVRPFVPVVFAWQMFQGITFYAVAAMASLSIHLFRRIERLETDLAGRSQPPSFLILKTDDGSERVGHNDIVKISGAGGCALVDLGTRTVQSSTTLGEFEGKLPEALFIRAHRSHIVALHAIERSEPAGNGRTTLHLVNGSTIITSRAGTQALREATV